jgi:hypothetical protein
MLDVLRRSNGKKSKCNASKDDHTNFTRMQEANGHDRTILEKSLEGWEHLHLMPSTNRTRLAMPISLIKSPSQSKLSSGIHGSDAVQQYEPDQGCDLWMNAAAWDWM